MHSHFLVHFLSPYSHCTSISAFFIYFLFSTFFLSTHCTSISFHSYFLTHLSNFPFTFSLYMLIALLSPLFSCTFSFLLSHWVLSPLSHSTSCFIFSLHFSSLVSINLLLHFFSPLYQSTLSFSLFSHSTFLLSFFSLVSHCICSIVSLVFLYFSLLHLDINIILPPHSYSIISPCFLYIISHSTFFFTFVLYVSSLLCDYFYLYFLLLLPILFTLFSFAIHTLLLLSFRALPYL